MLWFWFLSLSFLSGCASVWKDYYKVYFVRLDMFLSSSICLPFRVYQTNYWHPIFSWNMHDAFTQWGGFVYKDNKQLANLYLFLVRNKLQSWCAIGNDCKLHFAQFSLTVYFIFWPCWIFSKVRYLGWWNVPGFFLLSKFLLRLWYHVHRFFMLDCGVKQQLASVH